MDDPEKLLQVENAQLRDEVQSLRMELAETNSGVLAL